MKLYIKNMVCPRCIIVVYKSYPKLCNNQLKKYGYLCTAI